MNANEQVLYWHRKAQIDYLQHYMSLYAAFNAWYRKTTGCSNDREALNKLRKRNVLWDEYVDGTSLRQLRHPMCLLVECTQREPVSHVTPHWGGEVSSVHDWPSLVEYWYRVRCMVVHGVPIRSAYVHLAYDTLNIYMHEIVRRSEY